MNRLTGRSLAVAALLTLPLLAAKPAAADTIYPWCLYDTRGGVNCGFVSWPQCMASKTANADMCNLNGLYVRHPVRGVGQPYAPPRSKAKRYRSYRG